MFGLGAEPWQPPPFPLSPSAMEARRLAAHDLACRRGDRVLFAKLSFALESGAALSAAREVTYDVDILGSALNLNLVDLIERAGPYGAGAPKPLIRIRSARIEMSRAIGTGHKKIILNDGSGKVDAVAWRVVDRPMGDLLQTAQLLDVLGYVERNSWQGRDAVQFEIFDARLSK